MAMNDSLISPEYEQFCSYVKFAFSSSQVVPDVLGELAKLIEHGDDDFYYSVVENSIKSHIQSNIDRYTAAILSEVDEQELLEEDFRGRRIALPYGFVQDVCVGVIDEIGRDEEAFRVNLEESKRIIIAKDNANTIDRMVRDVFLGLYFSITERGQSISEVFGFRGGRANSITDGVSSGARSKGLEYEARVCEELRSLGWEAEVTKGSGDQGVDILGFYEGVRIAIQCKFYNGSVGNDSVQQCYAGMNFYDCDLGMVVTNSEFTPSAKRLASKLRVLLIHDSQLAEISDCLAEE